MRNPGEPCSKDQKQWHQPMRTRYSYKLFFRDQNIPAINETIFVKQICEQEQIDKVKHRPLFHGFGTSKSK